MTAPERTAPNRGVPAAPRAQVGAQVVALVGAVCLLGWALTVAWVLAGSPMQVAYVTAMVLTGAGAPTAVAWPLTFTAMRGSIHPLLAAASLAGGLVIAVGAAPLARVMGAAPATGLLRLLAVQLPVLALAAAGARRLAAISTLRAGLVPGLYAGVASCALVVFGPSQQWTALAATTVAGALVAAVVALPGLRRASERQTMTPPLSRWALAVHLLVGLQALMLANIVGGGATATTYLLVLGCWSTGVAIIHLWPGPPVALAQRALVAGALVAAIGPGLQMALGTRAPGLADGLTWLAGGMFAYTLARAFQAPLQTAGRAAAVQLTTLVTWAAVVIITMVGVGVVPGGNGPAVIRGLTSGAAAGLFVGLGLAYLAVRQLSGSRVLERLTATCGYTAAAMLVATAVARLVSAPILTEQPARIGAGIATAAVIVLAAAWASRHLAPRGDHHQDARTR